MKGLNCKKTYPGSKITDISMDQKLNRNTKHTTETTGPLDPRSKAGSSSQELSSC